MAYTESPEWTALKDFLTRLWSSTGVLDDIIPLLQTTFQWEHFLRYGVGKHFIGRKVGLDGVESLEDSSAIWKQVGYTDQGANVFSGSFTLPANLARTSVYSFRAYRYAQLITFIKLPILAATGGNETLQVFYFGLEHGAGLFNGIYCFELKRGGGDNNTLRVMVGPSILSREPSIEIKKPVNATTVNHLYRILYARNLVQFRIDTMLTCIAIPCGREDSLIVKENVHPYSIVLVPAAPSSLTPFIENYTNRTVQGTTPTVFDVSPFMFRFSEGNEVEPLNLPLYVEDTNTLAQGTVLAGPAAFTSHPFPIMGFTRKSLKFRATVAGTLSLQEFLRTNTWIEYDRMTTVAAPLATDPVETFDIENEHILTRTVFTPDSFPCTITHGEVDLS